MSVVLVERILAVRDFGVIFAGRAMDGEIAAAGSTVRVKAKRRAIAGEPAAGETWNVEGSIVRSQWGPQIEATLVTRVLPSGSLLKSYIATHVPGIGRDRAERLWRTYGQELPRILCEGDIPALAEVIAPDRPILGPRLAALLVREWRQADAEARLVAWLQRLGVVDLRTVRRVAAVYGEAAIDRLKDNPWALVTLLPWPQVDDLGHRLLREAGVQNPQDAPARLVGAADAVMKDVIATGSTAAEESSLLPMLARKLGEIRSDHPRVQAAFKAGRRNGAFVSGRGGLWRAPGCAVMEEAVITRLRHMLRQSPTLTVSAPAFAAMNGHGALHPEQAAAVAAVLSRPLACLQGGAGVGKTHTTRAVCAVWEAAGGKVLLAALAGKAALRLSRATGRLARTLFRTLRELEERDTITARLVTEDMDDEERIILEAKRSSLAEITAETLVVIDESSMVDLATTHALLRRMPEGSRLLLVGDERQLPPVSFGLVYHKLVDDPAITTRLDVVHRQTADSGIPAVAAVLRERQIPALSPYRGLAAGVSLIEAETVTAIAEGVEDAYHDLAGHDRLIVVPTREGSAGVATLNRRMHDAHVESTGTQEMVGALGAWFSVGEPVIFERNDYRRGLFNGSLGRVTRVDMASGGLHAEFDGDELLFERAELIDLSLAYALTCHRAQGSQAERVIVALTPCQLLDPSWLYTAVTRAERQVVIVGSRKTLTRALGARWAAEERKVGFEWGYPQP